MTAYIIYNGFWNAVPPDPVQRLHTALQQHNVSAHMVPNTALTACFSDTVRILKADGTPLVPDDFLLFWDKDTRLAFAAESAGLRVYNTAASIARCDDKSETHRILAAAGIPMPKTLVAPMTYVDVTDPIESFLDTAQNVLMQGKMAQTERQRKRSCKTFMAPPKRKTVRYDRKKSRIKLPLRQIRVRHGSRQTGNLDFVVQPLLAPLVRLPDALQPSA